MHGGLRGALLDCLPEGANLLDEELLIYEYNMLAPCVQVK